VPLRKDRPLGLAPATAQDYRELARRRLPRQLFDYIDGGASDEATLRANVADLAEIRLRQLVLRDVSKRDQTTHVLGQHLDFPVILAPVGMAGMYHTRAEVQAARAAESMGIPFTESTVSICGIEEVADATTVAPWFQLYVIRDRGYAENLMARAHAVGSPVLLLTVDLPVPGARHRDTRNGLTGEISHLAALRRGLDLAAHPRWAVSVGLRGKPHTFGNLEQVLPGGRSPVDFRAWVGSNFDPSVTWNEIAWVRDHWPGRLVVKGILDPDDARRAVDTGVDGVVVSNHGGRQLDSVPSSVRALPDVVAAIGDRTEVLVDGGIRSGVDVVKMLALGAKAVLVGRAWAWAVAAHGEDGVRNLLTIMRADIDTALALTGHNTTTDLEPTALYPRGRRARATGSAAETSTPDASSTQH
jgi:L-lactate dehydrogenase (cytochrome)